MAADEADRAGKDPGSPTPEEVSSGLSALGRRRSFGVGMAVGLIAVIAAVLLVVRTGSRSGSNGCGSTSTFRSGSCSPARWRSEPSSDRSGGSPPDAAGRRPPSDAGWSDRHASAVAAADPRRGTLLAVPLSYPLERCDFAYRCSDEIYTLPDLRYDYGALEPHISGTDHGAAPRTSTTPPTSRARTEPLERLQEARGTRRLQPRCRCSRRTWRSTSPATCCTRCSGTDCPRTAAASPRVAGRAASTPTSAASRRFAAHMTEAAATIQGSGWALASWEPLGRRIVVEQTYDHQGNHGQGTVPDPRHRRLGARLLPAVRERQAVVLRGALVHRRLATGRRPTRCGVARSATEARPLDRELPHDRGRRGR